MEALLVLIVMAWIIFTLLGAIGFFIAVSAGGKLAKLRAEIEQLKNRVFLLETWSARREAAAEVSAPTPTPAAASVAAAVPPPPVPAMPPPKSFEASPAVPPAAARLAAPPAPGAAADGPASPAAAGADWESRIGKRWLTWGGVLLLVVASGFLVKYAHDQGWIGPWTQILLGMAVGAGLCVIGDRQCRQGLRPLGQGVMACGLSLVYVSAFGAFAYFKLEQFSQLTTLLLLAATSAAGVFLANRHNSMPICILSAIGGYLAPILVATGEPPPIHGFLTYTLLVNLGILAVSHLRGWAIMPLLAFAGTLVHFGGWYYKFYDATYIDTVAFWACAFHFVFLLLPALPLIRNRGVGRCHWLLPLANAVIATAVIWRHLYARHPLILLAILLGMAAAHICLGLWNRNADDAKLARGVYLSLGLAILTLAPYSYFGFQAALVCWLLLGVLLVDFRYRLQLPLLNVFACVNIAIGIGWAVFKLDPGYGHSFHGADWKPLFGLSFYPTPGSAYLHSPEAGKAVLDRLFTLQSFWTRLLLPTALAAVALVLHRWRDRVGDAGRVWKPLAAVAAAFSLVAFIHMDLGAWLCLAVESLVEYRRSCALVALWSVAGAAVLAAGTHFRSRLARWASVLFIFQALGMVLFSLIIRPADPEFGIAEYANPGYWVAILFATAAVAAAYCLGGKWRWLYAGIAGYFFVLTQHAELFRCLDGGGEYREFWALGLLHTCFAMVYIALGRWRRGLLGCFAAPFLAALFYLICEYDRWDTVPAFRNMRYLTGLAGCGVVFLLGWALEKRRYELFAAGLLAVLGVTQAELYCWRGAALRDPGHVALAYYLGLWVAGAAVGVAAAWWRKRDQLFFAALAACAVAAIMGLALYGLDMSDAYWIFLNHRFAAAFAAAAAVLAVAVVTGRRRVDGNADGFIRLPGESVVAFYVSAASFGLIILTCECWIWALDNIEVARTARQMGQMNVSIAWAIYSTAMLVIGFIFRKRGWRLAGLVLFGLTCVKVVFVDLSHLGQFYRILSFMALGLLLMAASYMYHKLEKRLLGGGDKPPGDRDGPGPE